MFRTGVNEAASTKDGGPDLERVRLPVANRSRGATAVAGVHQRDRSIVVRDHQATAAVTFPINKQTRRRRSATTAVRYHCAGLFSDRQTLSGRGVGIVSIIATIATIATIAMAVFQIHPVQA